MKEPDENTFGQEIEMVTAALTLMMDRGVEGSRAGRSLDAFMRSLIKPSAQAEGAIRQLSTQLLALEETEGVLTKLGVSFTGDLAGLVSDADGNFRDLNEILALM